MAQLATKANSLLAAAFVLVLLLAALLYTRFEAETLSAQGRVQHTYDVLTHVKDLKSTIDDAETGQRGYLLTGREDYLAPYAAAADRAAVLIRDLKGLTSDNAGEQERLDHLGTVTQEKFAELARTIAARKNSGADAALAIVNTDVGRRLMDDVRDTIGAITDTERRLLQQRESAAAEAGTATTILAAVGAASALVLLLIGAMMLRGAARQRREADAAVRDAANRLRVSFDSLSQGIAVFGPNAGLIVWNHCFVVLLKPPPELLRPGTNYAAIAGALAREGEFLESEAQIRARPDRPGEPIVYDRSLPDGRIFELRRTGLPDGGFAVTVTDITAKIRAEDVQRRSQKMQALGELTGGVAHDFNNLLTVIAGNLDLLQAKTAHQPELNRYIAAASRGADRGTTLTRQLLAFGRRQALDPRATDLNTVANEIARDMLRRSLGERVDVKIVESAGLWPAFVDRSQLENAILNLALNARDAMSGGGKLTIEMANVTLDERYAEANEEVTPGQYVMIAVSDTGIGMPPEVAARAFEPFYTTKEEGVGSGLGLAMVHGFAKQSKGHVKIYSEPGHGTTIKLYLPRSLRAAADEPLAPVLLPRGDATILVVEDDTDVRRVAVAQLQELGYRVLEAADAEAGLRVFTDAGQIDLLLTDVVLPGRLRGRDLADLIHRASPATRILFMSGYT